MARRGKCADCSSSLCVVWFKSLNSTEIDIDIDIDIEIKRAPCWRSRDATAKKAKQSKAEQSRAEQVKARKAGRPRGVVFGCLGGISSQRSETCVCCMSAYPE